MYVWRQGKNGRIVYSRDANWEPNSESKISGRPAENA